LVIINGDGGLKKYIIKSNNETSGNNA